MLCRVLGLVGAVEALAALCDTALAKPARCYTSDDGRYACEFVATDDVGSFEISARNKPTFSLIIEQPGVASGYADYGSGSTSLPGRFHCNRSDPACWDNDARGTRICAW